MEEVLLRENSWRRPVLSESRTVSPTLTLRTYWRNMMLMESAWHFSVPSTFSFSFAEKFILFPISNFKNVIFMHIAGELFCSGHLISATNLKTAVWSSVRTSSQVERSRSSFKTTCMFQHDYHNVKMSKIEYRVAQICIIFWSIWCIKYLISFFLIICQFWHLSPHDWWQQRPAERQRLVGGLLWCGLREEPQGFQLLEKQVELELSFVNSFSRPLKCFYTLL